MRIYNNNNNNKNARKSSKHITLEEIFAAQKEKEKKRLKLKWNTCERKYVRMSELTFQSTAIFSNATLPYYVSAVNHNLKQVFTNYRAAGYTDIQMKKKQWNETNSSSNNNKTFTIMIAELYEFVELL